MGAGRFRNQLFAICGVILMTAHAYGTLPDVSSKIEKSLSPALRPPLIPTKIGIGVELIQVKEIERASKEIPQLIARFRLQLQWLDERLSLPLAHKHQAHAYQDQEASTKLNQIFDPKISIVDGTTELERELLIIYPNGMVYLSQLVMITVPANMNLTRYPFDSQTFKFEFASSYFTADEIELIINPLQTKLYDNAAPIAWSFDYTSHYIDKSQIKASDEPFSVFNFIVHAQRDARSFLWRLLIPLLVIVMLSWNVFWLFEDAEAALEICFLFLLTVVAFHQIANEMLPMVPFFTFMDSFVFLSYGFIIIPAFQVIITARLEKRGKLEQADRLRVACRWVVPLLFSISILVSTIIYFARG